MAEEDERESSLHSEERKVVVGLTTEVGLQLPYKKVIECWDEDSKHHQKPTVLSSFTDSSVAKRYQKIPATAIIAASTEMGEDVVASQDFMMNSGAVQGEQKIRERATMAASTGMNDDPVESYCLRIDFSAAQALQKTPARSPRAASTEINDDSVASQGFLMDVVRERSREPSCSSLSEVNASEPGVTTCSNDKAAHSKLAASGGSKRIQFWGPGNGRSKVSESSQMGAHGVLDANIAQATAFHGGTEEFGGMSIEAGTQGAFSMLGANIQQDNPAEEENSNMYAGNRSFDPCETQADSSSKEANDSAKLNLVEATLVEEMEVETLVEATLVEATPNIYLCPGVPVNRHLVFGALIVLVGISALALGLSLGRTGTNVPTLELIQKRGHLKCALAPQSPGLHFFSENGERSGLDVTLCRVLAAAVLGENAIVEFLPQNSYKDRFSPLAAREVDVVAAEVTHTMERQVYELSGKVGFAFSSPYLYEGLHFAGDPKYLECTENGLKYTEECADLIICTVDGTSHQQVLISMLPKKQLHVVQTVEGMVQALSDHECFIIAFEGYQLFEANIRKLGYKGAYEIGTAIYSKEPLCLMSRSDDPEWSSFVNVVLHGLFLAEKYNITKSTANLFPQTDLFGENFKNLFRDSLAVAGNYGELYSNYMEPVLARGQINSINSLTSASGLLYSHPMGAISDEGPAAIGYINQIQGRNKIRCGIIPGRQGFAALAPEGVGYLGIEIDLCRALSAALFAGLADNFELVAVSDDMEGYAALHGGLVDVCAGMSWNLEAYTYKSDTGSRVTFSRPYFYNNTGTDENQENLCLATASDDHSWSSFVYWVMEALIQAEENEIPMEDGNSMPEVNLFGPRYYQMFRDTILAVGNFGQMYNKSLEALFPRSARNLLNNGETPGPQIYPLPGMESEIKGGS